jgi:hypothetical protein
MISGIFNPSCWPNAINLKANLDENLRRCFEVSGGRVHAWATGHLLVGLMLNSILSSHRTSKLLGTGDRLCKMFSTWVKGQRRQKPMILTAR